MPQPSQNLRDADTHRRVQIMPAQVRRLATTPDLAARRHRVHVRAVRDRTTGVGALENGDDAVPAHAGSSR